MRWALAVLSVAGCLGAPPSAPPDEVDAGGELAPCDEVYGGLPGYQLCAMEEETCAFHVVSDGATCEALCVSFGTVCFGSYDTEIECVPVSADEGCVVHHTEQMCVCERPPRQAR